MTRAFGWTLAWALLTFGAVFAGTTLKAKSDSLESWKLATIHALQEKNDPRSLATAALLSYPAKTGLELSRRASALAPEDAPIGWLYLQFCANSAGCEVREAATAMRWIDADNAAAWLPILAIAQRQGDTVEIERILTDMADTNRFDVYWNPLVIMVFDSLKGNQRVKDSSLLTDWDRLTFTSELAGATLMPSLTPLIDSCREAAPDRRVACLKVSKIMQRGDTILAQLAGLAIEKHLVAPDGREARAIAERRRALEWRKTMATEFDSPLLPWVKNARARWRVSRMRTLAREEDVCIAILREHGLVTDPP